MMGFVVIMPGCLRCEFIDEKGADELMELVGMLTVREMERCKKNCEKDKK